MLTLILGYTLCGIIGSFFSTRTKRVSWWWAAMFVSPVLFLLAFPNYIPLVMNVNWIIASSLTLFFMGFFLTRTGVIRKLNLNTFFAYDSRPFEGGLFEVPYEANLGICGGTRPTGLGRYASIASLVLLCYFITSNTWYSFLGFLIFTLILLFAKGKTEIGAFIISMGFLLLITHNLFSLLMLVYLIIIGLSYVIIFGHIYYHPPKTIPTEIPIPTINAPVIAVPVGVSKENFKRGIITMGGRINGIWIDALALIKKSPLFGYGFGVERYLLKSYNGGCASVDSTLFNALLQSGIIGTLFFISALALAIISAFHFPLSLTTLEAVSVGIFILLRGINQSFSLYSADWLFLVPLIAQLTFPK